MTNLNTFKIKKTLRYFSDAPNSFLKFSEIFKIFHFLSILGPQNSDSLCRKLIKKRLFCIIFGTDLFFNTISRVGPEEISRYALGAEILQFETGAGPNFEFSNSGTKTEGGGITLWVGRHQPASHVAPAVDRQPGLRRGDS